MVLDVYWDGTNIATHSSSGGDWRPESTNKSATLSTTRLEFEEVGTGDQLGTFLDAVSVEEVPGTCYIEIDIDIKPQSYPNCFNLNGNGVIPVAILGSADFDVSEIDVLTLTFAGMDVRLKGNGAVQCSVEDVSGDFTSPEGAPDGYPDLVCQFVDDPDTWAPDDGTATVEGELLDGTAFRGTDEICLRPE
jgi:hypothetical protein